MHRDRRSFLAKLAAAAVAPWHMASASGPTAVSAGRRLGRIGLQLYTVRHELPENFDGTLAAVAEIGYREVEFAGYFERSPKQVRQSLDRAGLSAPSTHLSFETLTARWGEALETARLIGHRYLICPSLPQSHRSSLDGYKRAAQIFNELGAAARREGLQFGYHNHDFEFIPVEGEIPYDILLGETDRALVQLELDLYWITKGGRDPLEYFALYPKRFPLVHVKDMAATPERQSTEVGQGRIDFRRIFARADEAGIAHFFVEQEHFRSRPLESIRLSYEYLKRLEF